MATPPSFSLVLPTIGRKSDLARFCTSLESQTYRQFELVLVDQSQGDELIEIVQRFGGKFPVTHLRSKRGLSHGRNVGMTVGTGDVICFPDDDCWYGKDLLERVAAAFITNPAVDVLSSIVRDEAGAPMGRWDRSGGTITRQNVWRRACSMSIFVRRHIVDAVGQFDEMLGVGSGTPFSSGEETDFLIRIIDRRFACFYDPSLVAYHPNKKYGPVGVERSFAYGAGMGFVLGKHRYRQTMVFRALTKPLVGAVVYLVIGNMNRARYQLQTAKGRLRGYVDGRRFARSNLQLQHQQAVGQILV